MYRTTCLQGIFKKVTELQAAQLFICEQKKFVAETLREHFTGKIE